MAASGKAVSTSMRNCAGSPARGSSSRLPAAFSAMTMNPYRPSFSTACCQTILGLGVSSTIVSSFSLTGPAGTHFWDESRTHRYDFVTPDRVTFCSFEVMVRLRVFEKSLVGWPYRSPAASADVPPKPDPGRATSSPGPLPSPGRRMGGVAVSWFALSRATMRKSSTSPGRISVQVY